MSAAQLDASLSGLRRHRLPTWYQDAKFGIFIHWSVSSVIGWAPRERDINEVLRSDYDNAQAFTPYTEWYQNSLRIPGSPAAEYHRSVHGQRSYESFAPDFETGIAAWDPHEWARIFQRAGARYVVLVSKHHDGYCLWPSRVAHPHRSGWRSQRDCVRELGDAVRAQGMRFGIYYSGGLDWTFESMALRTMGDVLASVPGGDYPQYAEAQVRELIDHARPDVLWNDIAWPTSRKRLYRLLADYYRAVPDGVINDRWPAAPLLFAALRNSYLRRFFDARLRRHFRKPDAALTPAGIGPFDFQTPEYVSFRDVRRRKWECVRGMDKSFGYNRNSRLEDFLSHEQLIHSLADIVAKNGNLLLNVGPRGEDAQIPTEQLERLRWIGDWLERNGEAIYATRPWVHAGETTAEGTEIRYTARDRVVYAVVLGNPSRPEITLSSVQATPTTSVRLLGSEAQVAINQTSEGLRITLSEPWPSAPAHAVALRDVTGARSIR